MSVSECTTTSAFICKPQEVEWSPVWKIIEHLTSDSVSAFQEAFKKILSFFADNYLGEVKTAYWSRPPDLISVTGKLQFGETGETGETGKTEATFWSKLVKTGSGWRWPGFEVYQIYKDII